VGRDSVEPGLISRPGTLGFCGTVRAEKPEQ
jgi:hypothetical protein